MGSRTKQEHQHFHTVQVSAVLWDKNHYWYVVFAWNWLCEPPFQVNEKGKGEFGILVQPPFSKNGKCLVAKKREGNKRSNSKKDLNTRKGRFHLELILFLAILKLKFCHKFSGLWCLVINKGNCTYVLMSLLIPYTNVKSPDKALKGIRS